MFQITLSVGVLSVLVLNCAADLPEYIKTCSLDDPDLNKCILDKANSAIPNIIKYGAKFVVPEPRLFSDARVFNPRPDFFLLLQDIQMVGMEALTASKANLDLDTNKLKMILTLPSIGWISNYQIEGELYGQPIYGHGRANFTFVNVTDTFLSDLKTKNVGGRDFYTISNSVPGYKVNDIIYEFEGLYNGDQIKSDEMHKLLKSGWRVLMEELDQGTKKFIKEFYEMSFNAVLNSAPADKIFVSTNSSNFLK